MQQGKILIVDDESYTLDIMKKSVEREGFSVIACTNGIEAIAVAKKENPDVVLLDVYMPDLDGMQVLRELREKNIAEYVVMMSGQATKQTALDAMRAGAYDYLEKPIVKNELINIINKIFHEKKVLKELEQVKEDLLIRTEKLASIGQLASEIIHEIKNPLFGIKGYVQMMLKDQDLTQKDRDRLRLIENEVIHCEDIIKRALGFARKSTEGLSSSNINSLIEETIGLLNPKIEAKSITIEKKLDSSITQISLQQHQIRQVFLNIILNAIQAVAAGGKVLIETRNSNDKIDVLVTDNGCGVSDDNISKIFSPFFTTKNEPEGTGLGLAISKGIINRHRGTIVVESQEAKGSTFTISLPKDTPKSIV